MDGLQKMMTMKDIQKIFGCGKDKARAIVMADGFPKIQINREIYIPEDKFQRWIQKNIGNTIYIDY